MAVSTSAIGGHADGRIPRSGGYPGSREHGVRVLLVAQNPWELARCHVCTHSIYDSVFVIPVTENWLSH